MSDEKERGIGPRSTGEGPDAEVVTVRAYAGIRLLGRKRPCPGVPWNSPFSTNT